MRKLTSGNKVLEAGEEDIRLAASGREARIPEGSEKRAWIGLNQRLQSYQDRALTA